MLIILDRDGVINYDSDDYIKSPDEWIAIPESLQAISRLTAVGYDVVVATNQSGVGRGFYTLDTLKKIHQKMLTEIEGAGGKIKKIYFCPHHPNDQCYCRKPKPGMLLDIAKDFKTDLSQTYFIGDSLSDIQTGIAANAQPIFVTSGKGQKYVDQVINLDIRIPVYADLLAAVDSIL